MINPKISSAGSVPSDAEALDLRADSTVQKSCALFSKVREDAEPAVRSTALLPGLQALAKPRSLRVAIKAGEKILFISLDDVVSVQAKGNYVWLQQRSSFHSLRESISVLAERLEPYGFIRIHRSVLVNIAFVKEIRRLPTGECSLRVEGGKEYTVTRTYKNKLKSLAEFWIGTGAFCLG